MKNKTPKQAAKTIMAFIFGNSILHAQQPPSNPHSPSDSFTINLKNTVGIVSYRGEERRIYSNDSISAGGQTGPKIKAVYEPGFFPSFNPIKSGPGKICLTIQMDTDAYRQAALLSAFGANMEKGALIRLPFTAAVLSLGPSDPTEVAYSWCKAKVLSSDSGSSVDVIFDAPFVKNNEEASQLAKASSLRVEYGVTSQIVKTGTTTISLEVANTAIFSNKINGPVTASGSFSGQDGKPISVALTRNQVADAITKGWITIHQTTVSDVGSSKSAELSKESAIRLLPILINQLSLQQLDWGSAMQQVGNFSFDGEDAGTRIENYMKNINDESNEKNQEKLTINGSAEAGVLGFWSARVDANINKESLKETLRRSNVKFNIEGDQHIPASLEVMVIKSGSASMIGRLTDSENVVLGDETRTRELKIPIDKQLSLAGLWSSVPVGAVVPYFLTPEECAGLAPTWLPADGRKVTDEYSPLNGRDLPDITGNRMIAGGEISSDVTPNNPANIGGTLAVSGPVSVQGTTGGTDAFDVIGRQKKNELPRLVVDTGDDEIESANHRHNFSAAGTFSATMPLPPYRRLIYMVRARN